LTHELRNVNNIVNFIEKDRVQVDRKYVIMFLFWQKQHMVMLFFFTQYISLVILIIGKKKTI